MQLVLEDVERSLPVIIHPPAMTDEEYYAFCRQNEGFRIEREADGSIVFMAPAGLATGNRNSRITAMLDAWADQDGRGEAFDSNTEYILPDGSALSPDASWVSYEKIESLSPGEEERFPRLCPEFVIELMSPSDRAKQARQKMGKWIKNGVLLGWLIDPAQRTVTIYRPNEEPEIVAAAESVAGDGPVAGFVLELKRIWAGLRRG